MAPLPPHLQECLRCQNWIIFMRKLKKFDAALAWKHMEDFLVSRLRMPLVDRAAYSHLLRHSRLVGKARFRFSITWLSRGIGLCGGTARIAVRRLAAMGALRLVHRSLDGHTVEVRLPEEIAAVRKLIKTAQTSSPPAGMEHTDFLRTRALRAVIHFRERGLCFYCRRRINDRLRCLDHVKPLSHAGRNTYRNLVSSCIECNSEKGERSAKHHLQRLYRENRITRTDLKDRLRALKDLAAGKLRPVMPSQGNWLRPPNDNHRA